MEIVWHLVKKRRREQNKHFREILIAREKNFTPLGENLPKYLPFLEDRIFSPRSMFPQFSTG